MLLIVNTASKRGFAPQFEALVALDAKYRARAFVVLGFQSGDVMDQEYRNEKQIQPVCMRTCGVTFSMSEPVHVVGDAAATLYKDGETASGEVPRWKSLKSRVGCNGKFTASFGTRVKPGAPDIVVAIATASRATMLKATSSRARHDALKCCFDPIGMTIARAGTGRDNGGFVPRWSGASRSDTA